jgi:hypothetical protein
MNLLEYIPYIAVSSLAGLLLGWFLSKAKQQKPIMARDVEITALSHSLSGKTEENQSLQSGA